jgi:hypothetical protein
MASDGDRRKVMLKIRSKLLLTSLAMLSTIMISGFAQAEAVSASETARPAKVVTFPGQRVVRRIATTQGGRKTVRPMLIECQTIGCRRYLVIGVAY